MKTAFQFSTARSKSAFAILFLLTPTLFLCLSSCKDYKASRAWSNSQMEILKDNALLVRLRTSKHRIEALKAANATKALEEEKAKVALENQKTIDAFKNNYTFSKVYFFYSDESGKLKSKHFDEVKLFDTERDTVSDRSFLEDGYLVADFTSVYQDHLYTRDTSNVRYSTAGTSGLPALVVLDADYIQIGKPFPFRVMNFSYLSGREKAVTTLNKKLTAYYKKLERKKLRQQKRMQRKQQQPPSIQG